MHLTFNDFKELLQNYSMFRYVSVAATTITITL
jgi:hypothetical protein